MRQLLRILVFAATAALVISFFGLVVLQTSWFSEQLRRRLVRELATATGGQVELARLQFDPLRWSGQVEGLVVRGTEGRGEEPLFRAGALEFSLRIESFWGRRVDLVHLRLVAPEIHLRVEADGSTNLPSRRAGTRLFTEDLLDLAVDHFQMEGGALWWNDRRFPLEAAAANLRAAVRFDPAGRYAGSLEMGRAGVASHPRWPSVEGVSARFELLRDRLEIANLEVRTAASTWRASGSAVHLARPRWDFRYEGVLQAREVAAAVERPELQAGEIRLQGKGSWDSAGSAWLLEGTLAAAGMAVASREFRVRDVTVSSQYRWDPKQLELGELRVGLLGGHWSGRLTAGSGGARAQGRLAGLRVEQIAASAATSARPLNRLGWTAILEGALEVESPWPPDPRKTTVRGDLRWKPPGDAAGLLPVEGVWRGVYHGTRAEIEVVEFRLSTPASRLTASGRGTAVQFHVATSRPEELTAAASVFLAQDLPLPIRLDGGQIVARGALSGSLDQPAVTAALEVSNFEHDGRRWDSLAGRLEWSRSRLRLLNARLARGSTSIGGTLTARLTDGRFTDKSPIEAQVSLRDAGVQDLASLVGARVALTGALSGSFKLAGSQSDPRGAGSIEIRRGTVYDEPFDSLRAGVTLESGEVRWQNLRLVRARGVVSGAGAFHLDRKTFRYDLRGENLELAPGKLAGVAAFDLAGAGRLAADSTLDKLDVQGTVGLRGLEFDGRALGDLSGAVRTSGERIHLDMRSRLLGGDVTAQAEVLIRDKFPVEGRAELRNADVTAALDLAGAGGWTFRPPRGSVDASLSFRGQAREPHEWNAEGSVSRLELDWSGATATERISKLLNDGPIQWRLTPREVTFQPWRLVGEGSDLSGSGSIALGPPSALNLALKGGLNLAVLQGFRPGLTARGSPQLDVKISGTVEEPDIDGRVEIQDASVAEEGFPLGLDQITGAIRFSRRRATIEKLTAIAGGGSVGLYGEADFSGPRRVYRLRLETKQVRLRYPPGMLTVSDANLTFSGANQRSLLSGEVRLTRAGTRSQVDVPTILAVLRDPPRTPSGSDWLQGLQFNVNIVSAPEMQLDTNLARFLQADLNLRLQGSPLNPSLLGRVNFTQGEFQFQGTRYRVNRGDVSFVNPVRIDPIVNVELETRVSGYDISITLAGPAQKMNVSYRSDPPLPVNELITLLAVGRSPSTDPTLAAQQTSQARSLTQFGASSVVGQALARPLTGRLQRFFGVSRLKLDPEIGGPEGNPNARVTVEQQVGKDITFTYIYSLASAQQQIVRVEWAVSRQFSFIAVRDENGAFGVDFLYKKRYR